MTDKTEAHDLTMTEYPETRTVTWFDDRTGNTVGRQEYTSKDLSDAKDKRIAELEAERDDMTEALECLIGPDWKEAWEGDWIGQF